jgi:hypothetical protein
MRHLVALVILASLSACTYYKVKTADPSLLVVDREPDGYPITTNVRIGNTCTQVRESWHPFKDPTSGRELWLKQVDRAEAPCQ